MHRDHQIFIDGLVNRRRVRLSFISKEDDDRMLVRTCAPMDYGQGPRTRDTTPRYSFWDYDSDEGGHPLSLLPERIWSIEPLTDAFDPAAFVTWQTAWVYPRDWGRLS